MAKGEQVSEMLKFCREQKGFSQHELADRLHIDRTVVSKIETGKIIPSYTLVKEWAHLTNGTDVFASDITGRKDWKEEFQLKERINKARELLSFMRIRKAK